MPVIDFSTNPEKVSINQNAFSFNAIYGIVCIE